MQNVLWFSGEEPYLEEWEYLRDSLETAIKDRMKDSWFGIVYEQVNPSLSGTPGNSYVSVTPLRAYSPSGEKITISNTTTASVAALSNGTYNVYARYGTVDGTQVAHPVTGTLNNTRRTDSCTIVISASAALDTDVKLGTLVVASNVVSSVSTTSAEYLRMKYDVQRKKGVCLVQPNNVGTDMLDISDAGTGTSLTIDKTGSTGNVITIFNNGIDKSLNLSQLGDSPGLYIRYDGGIAGISSKAIEVTNWYSTGSAIDITTTGGSSGKGVAINMGAEGSGAGLYITMGGSGGSGEAISIVNNGTGNGLNINQVGSSDAVSITRATDNEAIAINKTGTGAGSCLDIINNGIGGGITITQSGAAAAISVGQVGSQRAFQLTQQSNKDGLYILKTGSGIGSCVYMNNLGTESGISITGANSLGATLSAADVFIKKTSLNDALVNYSYYAEVTNAGAGSAVGVYLNLSSGSGDEVAFSFNGDEKGHVGAGNSVVANSVGTFTIIGYIKVQVGGVNFYMPYGNLA